MTAGLAVSSLAKRISHGLRGPPLHWAAIATPYSLDETLGLRSDKRTRSPIISVPPARRPFEREAAMIEKPLDNLIIIATH